MSPVKQQDDALDATKGILILAIGLGHNLLLMKALPDLRWFLYNWHVYAFFLITFLVPFRSHAPDFLWVRLVRYGVPYLLFFSLLCIVNAATGGWPDISGGIGNAVIAGAIGSSDLLDAASGARLYWFLPALMGLTILRWAMERCGEYRHAATAIVAIAGFLFAGFIPRTVADYLPFGIPIALYIYGPCLVFGWLGGVIATGENRRPGIALGVAAIGLMITTLISLRMGTTLTLAIFEFYDIRQPLALFNHAALALSACGVVYFALCCLPRMPGLGWLGRMSLLIYLTHQLIYVAIQLIIGKVAPALIQQQGLIAGLFAFVLTIAASSAFAWLAQSVPRLKSLIAPRDFADFRASFRIGKAAAT